MLARQQGQAAGGPVAGQGAAQLGARVQRRPLGACVTQVNVPIHPGVLGQLQIYSAAAQVDVPEDRAPVDERQVGIRPGGVDGGAVRQMNGSGVVNPRRPRHIIQVQPRGLGRLHPDVAGQRDHRTRKVRVFRIGRKRPSELHTCAL